MLGKKSESSWAVTEFDYDRNGNLTHITYNMYHSITGRRAVTADQSSTVTESYGYYPDGNLRYAIGGGMRCNYSYDAMGRLVKKSASGRSLLVNEYDLNGNRIAMTDLTGKRTEYRYNSLDQLEAVVDNGKAQVHYTYNVDGSIRRMEVGTGLVTEYTYDQDKNVISQKTVLAGIEGMTGADFDNFLTLHNMNHREWSKPFTLADYAYTYDAIY